MAILDCVVIHGKRRSTPMKVKVGFDRENSDNKITQRLGTTRFRMPKLLVAHMLGVDFCRIHRAWCGIMVM
jgi:hypothetical protein